MDVVVNPQEKLVVFWVWKVVNRVGWVDGHSILPDRLQLFKPPFVFARLFNQVLHQAGFKDSEEDVLFKGTKGAEFPGDCDVTQLVEQGSQGVVVVVTRRKVNNMFTCGSCNCRKLGIFRVCPANFAAIKRKPQSFF
jgi:hypothetical protein